MDADANSRLTDHHSVKMEQSSRKRMRPTSAHSNVSDTDSPLPPLPCDSRGVSINSVDNRKTTRRLKHREIENRRRVRMKQHFEELDSLTTESGISDLGLLGMEVHQEMVAQGSIKREKSDNVLKQRCQDEILVNAILVIKRYKEELDALKRKGNAATPLSSNEQDGAASEAVPSKR